MVAKFKSSSSFRCKLSPHSFFISAIFVHNTDNPESYRQSNGYPRSGVLVHLCIQLSLFLFSVCFLWTTAFDISHEPRGRSNISIPERHRATPDLFRDLPHSTSIHRHYNQVFLFTRHAMIPGGRGAQTRTVSSLVLLVLQNENLKPIWRVYAQLADKVSEDLTRITSRRTHLPVCVVITLCQDSELGADSQRDIHGYRC